MLGCVNPNVKFLKLPTQIFFVDVNRTGTQSEESGTLVAAAGRKLILFYFIKNLNYSIVIRP